MARNSLKNVMRLIEAEKTKLPPEEEFLGDLKRSIELDDSKNSRIPSPNYRPSSMNCIRSMWYQRTSRCPDASDASYCLVGICNSGTDIHERIQKSVDGMKQNGIDCEYVDVAEYVKSRGLDYLEIVSKNGMETKLYHKELHMSFLCDGIIRYKGHYYILELKTETCNKWYTRSGVDEKHYNQGTAYSIAFNIPDVLFVYISRDNLDMKSFMFTPTDEMKQNLIGTIEECDGYVSRLVCPPKPENVTKKTCAYCNYKNSCKKEI